MGSGKVVIVALLVLLCAGEIQAASTVLFDQGHGERFLPDRHNDLDLSRLADICAAQGLTLRSVTEPFTDELLATGEGLILSGPFTQLTGEEVDSVVHFLARGGQVAIMLHIGTPVADLLHRLGVDVSNGVLREQRDTIDNEPLNFRVTRLEHHPLFNGVPFFSLYGGWALMTFADNAEVIAATSNDAWVDLDGDKKLSGADARQSFGVVIAGNQGFGRFLIFGDDAIFQNRFLTGENRILAENLATWFGGTKGKRAEEELRLGTESP